MRVFFWRTRNTRPGPNTAPPGRPAARRSRPGCYRSASYLPLRPWQVRGRRFGWTRFGQRGFDPEEVGEFLDRVAEDLAAVYAELDRCRAETSRVKEALQQWQSRQARMANSRAHH